MKHAQLTFWSYVLGNIHIFNVLQPTQPWQSQDHVGRVGEWEFHNRELPQQRKHTSILPEF